ncbi:quinolinate synthase NadA [Chloroflexia bacterium SDU3-3]|nr:quinolinate synthase NadA [Chloroflexia bacterium SDU3-3]
MTTALPPTLVGATCSPELELQPWNFDAPKAPQYGPGASQEDTIPLDAPVQQQMPASYRAMDAAELDRRIRQAKAILGEKLLILGHHYQRDEIIQYADLRGDSFKLSELAAARSQADYILFCGVHFMAESADVLAQPHQQVILPNMAAGCSMADMAHPDDVLNAWDQLAELYGPQQGQRQPLLPVTYMNSAASLKAFCGERGGVVCTSSNADTVLRWAFERGERVLFFPDQHLGRNTGFAMGIPLEQMVLWNPRKPLGGNTPEQLREAKIILWQGHCSVHKRFTVAQIEQARRDYPGVNVIVHPECDIKVVQAADSYGSTEHILAKIAKAEPGSIWAVGTEISMVKRLAAENPDKTIFCLDPVICPCSTMYRIHPAYVAWALDNLLEGRVINRITVDEDTKRWAKVALERMLQLR